MASFPVSVQRAAAYALAVALLCLPAIWNGFPLVFDDVGGYLERWPTASLGLGRSVPYGLLLWTTKSGWWVPAIVLQAVVTAWIIDRAMNVFGLGRSPWLILGAVAAIAATSGAAFFVSQVVPDAWAAPAVLALHLLAWHADRLTTTERVTMAAVVAFAGASHMATLGVLAGLSILHTAAWLGRRRLGVAAPGIVVANASVWCGIALLLAANFLVAGRFALTPGGDVILFGRLLESGIVSTVLAEECPRNDWRFCAFRHDLPTASEDFMWDTDSPLHKVGGWEDRRTNREIASIIAHSMLAHPLEHLNAAVSLTIEQLVTVGIADSMHRVNSMHLRWAMDRYAPRLVDGYNRSRQQQEEVDFESWSFWIVSPLSIAGTFALPFIAFLSWRQDRRREAMLPAMLFLALLGNAFICGVIAGPNDRYQARVAWLAPLVLALTAPARRQGRFDFRAPLARPLPSIARSNTADQDAVDPAGLAALRGAASKERRPGPRNRDQSVIAP